MPPSTTVCCCCNRSYETLLMVKCCICKKSFKNSCVDLTSNEVRTLNANKGYDWSCITCRAIGSDIKDLKCLILKLQEDIQTLKTTNSAAKPLSDNNLIDEVVAEMEDRAKRKCNLIIFGLDEQNQNMQVVERVDADKREILDIFRVIKNPPNINEFKPIRLGRYETGKKRAVRIQFNHEQQVQEIIRHAKNLKNSGYNKKIVLTFDRTPRQQELYKKARIELHNRLESGETNLKIKYHNNVPVIVTKN